MAFAGDSSIFSRVVEKQASSMVIERTFSGLVRSRASSMVVERCLVYGLIIPRCLEPAYERYHRRVAEQVKSSRDRFAQANQPDHVYSPSGFAAV